MIEARGRDSSFGFGWGELGAYKMARVFWEARQLNTGWSSTKEERGGWIRTTSDNHPAAQSYDQEAIKSPIVHDHSVPIVHRL
jgi:hypothetical protein